jgi:hypothetical protein
MITPGRYTIRNVASNFYLGLQLPLGLSSAVITLPPEDSSPDVSPYLFFSFGYDESLS